MQRVFRYRFYPTPEQESLLRRTLGCVRLVYNRALDARSTAWAAENKSISYLQTSAMLTAWKKQDDLEFLNEVSSVPLQQCLRHLQTAFSNFFSKRAKYPNFKKKRNGGSAEFSRSGFRWRDRQLFLAKCSEPLPIRWSRRIPEGCTPSTVTVSLSPAGRWHVSLLVDDHTIQPLPPVEACIGVDLGLKSLLITSEGEAIVNPRGFNQHRKRLAKAQKVLARKQKGSRNRQKARERVARIHAKITDSRRDHLHKLTTRLVKENQLIAVENLCVKGMLRSKRYSRSIADAAWGELVRQLEYKANWYGRILVKVDRFFPSSKTCSECGHVMEAMPERIRDWDCPSCGVHHDRDINAARNVLAAGLAVAACGAPVRPNSKHRERHGQ
jgi:putative transposase